MTKNKDLQQSHQNQSTHVIVGFPVYSVGYLPYSREIIVAGGGGSTRSGVLNGISLYRITKHNLLTKTAFFSTGIGAVMAMQPSTLNSLDFLAAINSQLCLYGRVKNELICKKRTQLEISGMDGYIKCVSQQGSHCAAGTNDGKVHIFRFPSLIKLTDGIVETEGEIEDVLLGAATGERVFILTKNQILMHRIERQSIDFSSAVSVRPPREEQHFRCIGQLSTGNLVVAVNGRDKKSAFMCLYTQELEFLKCIQCFNKPITSISISFDQTTVAFGTSDGSLGVVGVEEWNVKCMFKEVHDFAITGVAIDNGGKNVFACSPNGKLNWSRIQMDGAKRASELLKRLAFIVGIIAISLFGIYFAHGFSKVFLFLIGLASLVAFKNKPLALGLFLLLVFSYWILSKMTQW